MVVGNGIGAMRSYFKGRIYQNGKNVYKNISGEWFAISRDTLSLLIDAASGNGLVGTMEYVERYL